MISLGSSAVQPSASALILNGGSGSSGAAGTNISGGANSQGKKKKKLRPALVRI